MQGFETQHDHNPNGSISTVISTSCVILDGSHDSNCGFGDNQSIVAGAVATTSVLPINRTEVNPGNSTHISDYQSAHGNQSFVHRPLESEMYDFNWTGSVPGQASANGEGYAGLVTQGGLHCGSRPDHDVNEGDWTKCFYYEDENNYPSVLTESSAQKEHRSATFSDGTCNFRYQEPDVNFLMQTENCNSFQVNTRDGPAYTKTSSFHHFDDAVSNHLDQRQTNCRFDDANPIGQSHKCNELSTKYQSMYSMNSEEIFSPSYGLRNTGKRTNPDRYYDPSSSFCCSTETDQDQGIAYSDEHLNNRLALNTMEMVPFNTENGESGFYQAQRPVSERSNTDTYQTSRNGSTPIYNKTDLAFNDSKDGAGKITIDSLGKAEPLGHLELSFGMPMMNIPLNKESKRQVAITNMKSTENDMSTPKGTKSDPPTHGVQRGKKKNDTVESLQRQLLILEERRSDRETEVRPTDAKSPSECDTLKTDAQEHVLVDVDHMICSGVTVAGFKPRATIR